MDFQTRLGYYVTSMQPSRSDWGFAILFSFFFLLIPSPPSKYTFTVIYITYNIEFEENKRHIKHAIYRLGQILLFFIFFSNSLLPLYIASMPYQEFEVTKIVEQLPLGYRLPKPDECPEKM